MGHLWLARGLGPADPFGSHWSASGKPGVDRLGLNSDGVKTNDEFEQHPYVRLLKVRLATERGDRRGEPLPYSATERPGYQVNCKYTLSPLASTL